MIESINDFLKNFKERFSSPFFFSFTISWIALNWKVTIALLWYESSLYPNQGDLINFIEFNTSNLQSIVLPTLSAALYTGIFRNVISAFVAFSTKWGGNLNLKISKDSSIPMSKFLTYRNLYLESNKNLETVIKDERKAIERYDTLNKIKLDLELKHNNLLREQTESKSTQALMENKLRDAEVSINELSEKIRSNEAIFKDSIDFKSLYSDYKRLEGIWKFKYRNSYYNITFEEKLAIKDNVINRINGNHIESVYRIEFYFYDVPHSKIYLHLSFVPQTKESVYVHNTIINNRSMNSIQEENPRMYGRLFSNALLIQVLDVKNENLLFGLENKKGLIEYERENSLS